MNWAPRIPLRNIFLLFFCAAVGLATNSDPIGAIEPAIATAMVIGLIQQTRQFSLQQFEVKGRRELAFARHFALAWRLALAATIAVCVILRMVIANGFFQHPEPEGVVTIEAFTSIVPVCIIIVLLDSLGRWRSKTNTAAPRQSYVVLLSALAIMITTIMVVEGATIEHLVHRAVAGIEAASPKHLQRPGIYPKLSEEGYLPLWIALGAVLCLFGATAAAMRLRHRRSEARSRWFAFCAVLVLLIPPMAFCFWYYLSEFHRLSPEMAGVGLALTWWDWMFGAWIGILLVTAGAYRLGKVDTIKETISPDLSAGIDEGPLHETWPCLLLLAGISLYALWFWLEQIFKYGRWFGAPSIGRYISMLCYPITLLTLATCAACLQLCWYRWKNRSATIPWQLFGLSPLSFWRGWVALVLLLIVGIPTSRAFGFIVWLGPLDLLRLFGLQ